jgi:hypothetical protein
MKSTNVFSVKTVAILSSVLLVAVASFWTGVEFRTQAAASRAATVDASQYPNLQAAIDALPDSGGVLQLPPGDFEVSKPLMLSCGDVRIQGAGTATHLINRNEEGQPALILRHKDRPSAKTGRQREAARLWRIHLVDFRISGNSKSGDGILAEGINEIFIHNMAIDHNGGHGIQLLGCYEDPRVVNSIITYNGKAGLNIVESHDIVVSANQFEENQDSLRCIDSYNLCMNGNNIDDHLRHGVVVENTYGSVIAGNMIEECAGTAIILDRDCYGITVSANVLAHNGGGGVDLRDAWGSTVSANTFVLIGKPSLVIGPDSGRITVTGNTFSNSEIGGKTRRPEEYQKLPAGMAYATGVLLRGTSDITISGNTFSGLAEYAVKTEGKCKRIVLTGNIATDLWRKTKQKLPAFDLAGATEVVLGENGFEKGFEVKRP